MRNDRLRIMVEIALAIALAAVLNWFGVRLPWNIAGGRVALDMLPIFVVALRRGLVPGLIAGALWGALDLLFDPFIVHPAQVVLDYPLAFALCGLAGLGSASTLRALAAGRRVSAGLQAAGWSVLGGLARFASHLVSGVIFFGANAPAGQPVWLYSAIYNLSYLGPSIAACAILAGVLVPALDRAVPVSKEEVV
jgi:thiamine transporter